MGVRRNQPGFLLLRTQHLKHGKQCMQRERRATRRMQCTEVRPNTQGSARIRKDILGKKMH